MKAYDVCKAMNEVCPVELQEEWDNSGPQIIISEKDIKRILISLEITSDVIDEAIEKDVDMIVTHHPLLFKPKNVITDYSDPVGKLIIKLIQSGLSVYSSHTNFDKMQGGNNDFIGDMLGIVGVESNGIIRSGKLKEKMSVLQLARKISQDLDIPLDRIKLVGDLNHICFKICWCTGKGGDYIIDAKNLGADIFITGDVTYHEAISASELGINILDIGHFGSEKIFVPNMGRLVKSMLRNYDPDVTVIESKVEKDPYLSIE